MMNIKDISADFQLIGHITKSVRLKNDFVTLSEVNDLKKTFEAEYAIQEMSHNEDRWLGIVHLQVKCNIQDKKKHKLFCDVLLEGAFVAPPDMEDTQFEKMLGLNGCSSLYSIARAYIISLTSLSLDVGKVILPMINVFKLKDKGSKNPAE